MRAVGTRPEKIRIQKWYNIFKDHITLEDCAWPACVCVGGVQGSAVAVGAVGAWQGGAPKLTGGVTGRGCRRDPRRHGAGALLQLGFSRIATHRACARGGGWVGEAACHVLMSECI